MTGGAHPLLAAFGNPLLDIIVDDEENELVERFSLAKDVAQEVDTHDIGLYDKVVKKPAVEYAGGGCALNTVRVFQWLSGVKNESVFLGGLGTDEAGDILETLVNKDGVQTAFAKHQELSTGHCIALVDGAERTLCANLGAANKYDTSDLWNSTNEEILLNSKVIYVEGFFLAHSFTTSMELATFAQRNNIIFVFNLCGEYVCEDISYVENVLKILPFVDILFGNRSEFDVFIKTQKTKVGPPSSLVETLRALITGECIENLGKKVENICDSPVRTKQQSLTVVVTEGCQPVQCFSIGDNIRTLAVLVPKLGTDLVKDTIGAGDSFIAGFIYVLLQEGSLRACIEYAIWAAQRMIQQVGVTLPDQAPEGHFMDITNKRFYLRQGLTRL